ncbi:MAG: hypothetical protein ACW99G_17705 [Candidatus Thorarchaeota archaeon]
MTRDDIKPPVNLKIASMTDLARMLVSLFHGLRGTDQQACCILNTMANTSMGLSYLTMATSIITVYHSGFMLKATVLLKVAFWPTKHDRKNLWNGSNHWTEQNHRQSIYL